jgi:hypothetical protein
MCCYDVLICVYIVKSIELFNIPITSLVYLFFVVRMIKIYFSNFEIYKYIVINCDHSVFLLPSSSRLW